MDTVKYYFVIYMLQIFHFAKLLKTIDSTIHIQGDSGEKVNILGCDDIGNCEKKRFI